MLVVPSIPPREVMWVDAGAVMAPMAHHLTRGDRRDNKHDDWTRAAYGVDHTLLPREGGAQGVLRGTPAHPLGAFLGAFWGSWRASG